MMVGWSPTSLCRPSKGGTLRCTVKANVPFCYCDLIEGFDRLMNQDALIGPVNIGNPGEFTILELAEKVIALTGSKSKIIHEPLPADDPQQRQPDIAVAREQLGWEPTVSLDEGLKPTIEYFDQLLREGR